jgi:hypothetical protein
MRREEVGLVGEGPAPSVVKMLARVVSAAPDAEVPAPGANRRVTPTLDTRMMSVAGPSARRVTGPRTTARKSRVGDAHAGRGGAVALAVGRGRCGSRREDGVVGRGGEVDGHVEHAEREKENSKGSSRRDISSRCSEWPCSHAWQSGRNGARPWDAEEARSCVAWGGEGPPWPPIDRVFLV